MKERVPITGEQRKLSYAKYYDKPMAPVQEEKLKYLEQPIDATEALHIEDRNLLPEGTAVPVEAAKGLLAHNMREFENLGDLLPRIYPEEKDNWE